MPTGPDPIEAIRDSIRSWRLAELALFAEQRHDFGNTDGGFGVSYPGDVDEYDREVVGVVIPSGYVRVYGYWGPPDGYELDVPERLYLDTLAVELDRAGLTAEAERVRADAGMREAEADAAPDYRLGPHPCFRDPLS